jgi:hypothetical protein
LSRLIKIYWDLLRNLDIIEAFWESSGSKFLTVCLNLDPELVHFSTFSIKIEKNCPDLTKFSGLHRFLDRDWDFLLWKVDQKFIKISQSRSRYLDRQDKLFEAVKIILTVETYILKLSRLRVSIETRSRQIETPRLKEKP